MTGPTWISDGSALPDPHGRGERAVDFHLPAEASKEQLLRARRSSCARGRRG